MLLDCLKEYGEISGYLANEVKAIAMMLSRDSPMQLKQKVHIRWAEKEFRYLGMIIGPSTSQSF